LSEPDFDSIRPARAKVAAAAALAATAVAALLASSALAGGGGLSTGTGPSGQPDKSQPSPLNQAPAKYDRMWRKVTPRDKRWASRTADCESGRDPDAIGGGGAYRGAFQFMRSTWRTSPKSPGGDPTAWNYRTQAVVAVALKRQQGTSPWPVCG
jgi:hypothetical protein